MINAFSNRSSLNTKYSLEDYALWPYYKNYESFSPKNLNVKKSQKLCHVQFSLYWLTPDTLIYYFKS